MADNNPMDKEFRIGDGKISGALALFLGISNVAGVLGFYFPEYLTTPEMRQVYTVDGIRRLMTFTIFLSIALGCFAIFRGQFLKNLTF